MSVGRLSLYDSNLSNCLARFICHSFQNTGTFWLAVLRSTRAISVRERIWWVVEYIQEILFMIGCRPSTSMTTTASSRAASSVCILMMRSFRWTSVSLFLQEMNASVQSFQSGNQLLENQWLIWNLSRRWNCTWWNYSRRNRHLRSTRIRSRRRKWRETGRRLQILLRRRLAHRAASRRFWSLMI